MSKQILIDSCFGMVRTAIAEGRELLDYYEESPEQGRNKGNIYRGVVKKVDAPIQAAFVKFTGGRDGFLPLRDAGAGKAPKPGDPVLVQVVKDEVGDKGAALTAKLSLSGRYLVYIPERDGEGGISSKITDEERAALKKVLGQLRIPDGASVILRTAASDKSAEALQADLDKLIETHRELSEKFDRGGEPGLLFREAPPALRYLREYYTDDIERIWVNQEDVLEQCRQFFYQYEPESASKVVLSQDGPLLFQRLGLEADVEKLSGRRVGLPSGANFVIDQTEALVAIDVNSAKAGGRGEDPKPTGKDGKDGKPARGRGKGKPRGGDLEETVFAVNLEAAGEIARQLRLRDLGGIIIVDFIDMESDKHKRQIEDAMRKALATDKAKVKVYDIGPLGTMEISRQRLRKAGHQFGRLGCEACQGRGWHPSASAGALSALRKLEERLIGKKAGQSLAAAVPYPVANKLMNEFRDHLLGLEKRYGCTLRVTAQPAASGEPNIVALGGGGEAGGDGRGRDPQPSVRPAAERGEAKARGTLKQAERREAPEAPAKAVAEAPPAALTRGRERGRGAGRKAGSVRTAESVPVAIPKAEKPSAVPTVIDYNPETATEDAPTRAAGDESPGGRRRGRRGGRGRNRAREGGEAAGAPQTARAPQPAARIRAPEPVRTPIPRGPAPETGRNPKAVEGEAGPHKRSRRRRGRGGSGKSAEPGANQGTLKAPEGPRVRKEY